MKANSFCLAITSVVILFSMAIQVGAQSPPNIVFILADDVGVESMTPYGGSSWPTPLIDSIATQGMRFELAFATPCCAPTRAQFLTGRYPFRTGVTYPTLPNGPLASTELTLATVLKSRGYSTGLVGKWNLRYGNRNGASLANQAAHIEAHGFQEHSSFIGHTIQYGNPAVEADYVPYQLNQWACDFIDRKSNGGEPFYLQYSLGLVHTPITPTPLNPDGGSGSLHERYGYMMEYMDKMTGNILDAIDAAGISQNTVVIFGGDNGTYRSITSTFQGAAVPGGKLTNKDSGSWVPFYVRWPGVVTPGTTYPGLMDFSDIFPTLIEIAGGTVPNHNVIDGISFLPQLQGNPEQHREFIYASDVSRGFVRDDQFKLVGGDDLYDTLESPIEERLIIEGAETPEEQAARARLAGHLSDIQIKQASETGLDSDADGETDYQEMIAGTHPLDRSSKFAPTSSTTDVSGTNYFTVEWESVPGRLYTIKWSPDLTSEFQTLDSNIEYPQNSYTDIGHGAESEGFYKIEVRLK